MEWVSSMAAWPSGTWRNRGSGGAHGRVDTWVGYVGREACIITGSREFGEGTGGGSVVLARAQKKTKNLRRSNGRRLSGGGGGWAGTGRWAWACGSGGGGSDAVGAVAETTSAQRRAARQK
eukprot:5508259-Prymnesium_polylepis.1